MSGGWSYDRLPSIHESVNEARDQDITEFVAQRCASEAIQAADE
jgi:hypothetical protein|tara:strand:- start:2767 stop:2898 length:132 start_codon:yes stop_codon:yes gene_type:complete